MVPGRGRNDAGYDTYWTIRTRHKIAEDIRYSAAGF